MMTGDRHESVLLFGNFADIKLAIIVRILLYHEVNLP